MKTALERLQRRGAKLAGELQQARRRRELLYAILLKTAGRLVVADKLQKRLERRTEELAEELRKTVRHARSGQRRAPPEPEPSPESPANGRPDPGATS